MPACPLLADSELYRWVWVISNYGEVTCSEPDRSNCTEMAQKKKKVVKRVRNFLQQHKLSQNYHSIWMTDLEQRHLSNLFFKISDIYPMSNGIMISFIQPRGCFWMLARGLASSRMQPFLTVAELTCVLRECFTCVQSVQTEQTCT